MLKKHNCIIILSIFILILGANCIFAAEDNNSTTIDTDSILIDNTENTQIVEEKNLLSDTAGTFTELSTQIEASENLVLDKNYTRGSNENIIHINKTITINGQNNTINANGYNGVFNISSTANVTLQNMIITNASDAYSSYTAPIYAEGTLTLINVTITDNYYSYGAGAITQEDGQLTVINSTFMNNYGQQGGAVLLRYGTSTMDNITVTNCSSMNGGIFIQYASASLNISNSTFKDNYANNYGGAIDASRGSLVVNNCIFTNNSAGVFGGAIALRTSKVTSIYDSTFTSNYVNGSTYTKRGGAIYSTGTVNLVNNTMTDNYAYNGTTIFLNEGVVNNTYVKVNDQTSIEDEIFTIEATVTDDNNNTITGGTLTITINGEEYTSEVVEGVATYTISTSLEANTYTITSLYSQVDDDTICIYTDGTLVVTAADVFKYRMLQESIDQDTTGTITLEKIVKRGSSEDKVIVNKTITIDGNNFAINANNGRIFEVTDGATLTLKNMVIYNIQYAAGGLAKLVNGNLVLENVTIINNTLTSTGYNNISSLILVDADSTLNINNTTIANSTGAVIKNQGTTIINNTVINNITATDDYNQGWIDEEGSLSVYNSIFTNNEANLAGIYGQLQKSLMTIENTSFINNTVNPGNGGAIKTNAPTVIRNSTFINNSVTRSDRDGGAIYAYDDLNITNSIFINNSATGDGSAIYNGYGTTNITNSIIIPDSSTTSVIYNDDRSATTIANYNWWSTNTIASTYTNGTVTLDYWLVMQTTTIPVSDLEYNTTVTLITTISNYTDSTGTLYAYSETIPDGLLVTYDANRGEFTSQTTTITNGETTNYYTVLSEDIEITVTQANQVNTISTTAILPTPQTIIITEENFYDYFYANGSIKKDKVPLKSELQFSGSITNKLIILDIPLNLTSYTTQTEFENLVIAVVDGAQTSNITNLIINNNNYNETVISLINVDNILIKNNTITTTNQESITHTITLNNTNYVTITNNTIKTNGPSDNIRYDEYYVGYPDTSSIKLYNSSYNTVSQNIVITNYTTVSGTYNTISSIEVYGNVMASMFDPDSPVIEANYNNITDNNITTIGVNYAYGITVSSNVNNNIISNNIITTNSSVYANGIQLLGPATYNNVTGNDITTTSENVTYGLYISTNYMGSVTNNNINDNTVTSQSSTIYLIELWGIQYNNINNNKLNARQSDYAMGIGTYNSKYNNISYNQINVNGSQVNSAYPGDSISAENVGVLLYYNSNYNNVTYNNITSTSPNENYAVKLNSSTYNIVAENDLHASVYTGDLAVYSSSTTNTITNNTPLLIITDDTYSNYFNDDGTIKSLTSGLTIYLSGTFYNKDFIIDIPLSIYSDVNQAVLVNSTIYFTTGSAQSIFANIIVNDTDYTPTIITIDSVDYISIINNTLIQNNSEGDSHAIDLEDTSYNVIKDNNITVQGISADIVYSTSYSTYLIGFANTSAIKGFITSYNNITDNSITTIATTAASSSSTVDTIIGIDIYGNTMNYDYSRNNIINNNNITTTGLSYAYSIRISNNVRYNDISYNKITTTARNNSYGIEVDGPCNYNNVTNNDINVSANDFAYGLILSSNSMGAVQYNIVDSNNITGSANGVYLIELYVTTLTNITNNNLNGTGNYVIGIGGYNTKTANIKDNTIITSGDSSKSLPVTVDQVTPANNGIKLVDLSSDNNITGNIIYTYDNVTTSNVYTIDLINITSNTVTNNTLYSSNLDGSHSVNYTSDNTVRDNKPSTPELIIITITDASIRVNKTGSIEITVTDLTGNNVEFGSVTVTINNELVGSYTVSGGKVTIEYENTEVGTYPITVVYEENSDYLSNSTSSTIDIYPMPTYTGVIYVSTTTGKNSNNGTIDDPLKTIEAGIEAALIEGGSHQVIILEGTYYVNNIIINDSINITGNGNVILDANQGPMIFNITTTNGIVILENLVITNVVAKDYGAIYNSANSTFINLSFINNTGIISSAYAGAIYTINDLTIINSTFINNSVPNGTGSYGGAIYKGYRANATLTIINTLFENNYASGSGGAIYASSSQGVIIDNCTFINNSDGGNGGAIYSSAPTNITNSVFINNSATRYGGALYISGDSTIINTIFDGNNASSQAGAIYASRNLALDNVTITNSYSPSGSVIYYYGSSYTLNITNSDISNNNGRYGIIYVSAARYFNVTDSIIENNTATSYTLIWVSSTSTHTNITRSNFTNNNAEDMIYLAGSTQSYHVITDSNFINNSVDSVLFDMTNAISENNVFIGNGLPVTITAEYPSRIVVNTEDTITITISTSSVYNTTVNGILTILDNGEAIATIDVDGSVINYDYTPTSSGTHNITLVFSDETGSFIETSTSFTISTTDEFIIDVDGNDATITITITDIDGTPINEGYVIIKINGITIRDDEGNVVYLELVNGVATTEITLPELSSTKDYNISYVYSGSSNYDIIRSSQIITIEPQSVIITIGDIISNPGKTITLTAYITDEYGNNINNGKVVFKINGKTLKDADGNVIYVEVINGVATLEYLVPDNYSAKNYIITVVYQGNGYERSQMNATLTLEKYNNIIVTNSEITIDQGSNTQLKATITDENGNLVTVKTKIAIKINSKTMVQTYITDGIIDLVLYTSSFTNPTYNITIIVGENSVYNRNEYNITLTVKD